MPKEQQKIYTMDRVHFMDDRFYIIYLIDKRGQRGYLMDSPNGIAILPAGQLAHMTQFKTYADASNFIRERKVERGGIKAYIWDNTDLIRQGADTGIKPMEKGQELFYVENEHNEKCFFDSKLGYYFDKRNTGYCIWYSEEDAREFVKQASNMPLNTQIKKMEQNK